MEFFLLLPFCLAFIYLCIRLCRHSLILYIVLSVLSFQLQKFLLHIFGIYRGESLTAVVCYFYLFNFFVVGWMLLRISRKQFGWLPERRKREVNPEPLVSFKHTRSQTVFEFVNPFERIPWLRNRKKFLSSIFKLLINWPLFLIVASIVSYHYFLSQTVVDLETYMPEFFEYYALIAWFFLFGAFMFRISHFISVSIAILIILLGSVLLFLYPDGSIVTNGDWVISFIAVFAIPPLIVSALILLLSIPRYFKLIFRRPQYFMFSVFVLLLLAYFASLEYRLYGLNDGYYKYFCSVESNKEEISGKTLRVLGSEGEGTGFFITEDTFITNRHVVENEDYPKIVLPNGTFITPYEIKLSKDIDLAMLKFNGKYPNLIIKSPDNVDLKPGEELYAFGFPLGTAIIGEPTVVPIKFESYRTLDGEFGSFIQFSDPIVSGMSGGPVVDKCGNLVGINTLSSQGISLALSYVNIMNQVYVPVETESPRKVELHPGQSPEESVYAYYYLLKARDTEGCYSLLSSNYKTKSTYEEWTARFPQVDDVYVVYTKEIKPGQVYVRFNMTEWDGQRRTLRKYEGVWWVVKEGDQYLLDKSFIREFEDYMDMKGPEAYLRGEVK